MLIVENMRGKVLWIVTPYSSERASIFWVEGKAK
jgi:hypothetical protein